MGMHPGLIGGIAGGVIGLIGGLIGTYATIHNTNGPRERAFTIRASIIGWIVGLVFLALLFLLPTPWRFLVWIPFGILLSLGINRWNRTQQRIRREEAGELQPGSAPTAAKDSGRPGGQTGG